MKSLKTPLRYPGGKSRAITKIAPYLSGLSSYNEYREPFLGGGSMAIHVTKLYPNMTIWVNDLYEPLVTFWQQLQTNGDKLHKKLQELKSRYPDPSSAKGLFLQSKDYLAGDSEIKESLQGEERKLWTAVAFYIVNKCSFSGLTESSSFSSQASDSNFSMRGISKLPGYTQLIKNWKITNLSYEQLLTDDKLTFTYLDPPYDIRDNLYGRKGSMHKSFDHDAFASNCDRFVGPQLISYNSSQLVKERFRTWEVGEYTLTYTMRSVGEYMREQKERKELLLFNYEKTLENLEVQSG